jgi:alginate O-acetyltransferase complex protein AlgI
MVFTESKFILFLIVAFAVFWSLPRQNQRKHWLLLCSYLFYAGWDYRFTSLLFISTVIDYEAALRIHRSSRTSIKRAWLAVSVIGNLGILGTFKYFDFFSTSFAALVRTLGWECDPFLLQIALPVGVSFYTFQTLSYTIDVYRGQKVLYLSFLDFALFVAFFPQLVAGPIVRAGEFLPQIQKIFPYQRIDFRGAALYLAAGFFKKAVIADNIAFFIDPVFLNPSAYDQWSIWICVYAYCVQLYCDFSGYADIAIGLGKLFGVELPQNFRYPLLSTSFSDLWRRWHLTLSTWFRDYVFQPLGGSSRNLWKTARNIIITMTLVGFWHGPSGKFLTWGLANGIALSLELLIRIRFRKFVARRGVSPAFAALSMITGLIYGQFILGINHIMFRAPDLERMAQTYKQFFALASGGSESVDGQLLYFFCGFWAIHLGTRMRFHQLSTFWNRLHPISFSAAYGLLWALLFTLAIRAYQPFVYFAF